MGAVNLHSCELLRWVPAECLSSRPACLCRTHSGRISSDDLLALLELCRSRAREYQFFELEAQLQARHVVTAGSFETGACRIGFCLQFVQAWG